jgi:hypothetical protein
MVNWLYLIHMADSPMPGTGGGSGNGDGGGNDE